VEPPPASDPADSSLFLHSHVDPAQAQAQAGAAAPAPGQRAAPPAAPAR
jgi:hypothetical protein